MYLVEMYVPVRRARMVEGMSVRETSRVFSLHRDTVRKMLAYSVPPGYRRQSPPLRPKLEPFTAAFYRQACRHMSGPLPAAVVVHHGGGSAPAYSRWSCRVRRCLATQSGQRVCPRIVLFGQSLHSPSFLRRWRSSRACTRESSRFSSSVSWGLVGLVVDFRLAEPARALRPGLEALRFRGRVLPALAGLGRMKVNSKVPPIGHLCGGTTWRTSGAWRKMGLSPRVRGVHVDQT